MIWSPDSDPVYGQQIPNYAENGTLWGTLTPSSGDKSQSYNAQEPETHAEIRLRQWVNISVKDRLLDKQFNEVWIIDGSRRTTTETVLTVHKFEQQVGT